MPSQMLNDLHGVLNLTAHPNVDTVQKDFIPACEKVTKDVATIEPDDSCTSYTSHPSSAEQENRQSCT